MSCCKDTKYNILLKFDQTQRNNKQFQNETILKLSKAMNWSNQKSKTIVEFASLQGYCLIDSQITEEVAKTSMRLAEQEIPHEVKLSKK